MIFSQPDPERTDVGKKTKTYKNPGAILSQLLNNGKEHIKPLQSMCSEEHNCVIYKMISY